MLVTLTIRKNGYVTTDKTALELHCVKFKNLKSIHTGLKKMFKHDFQTENYPALMTNIYKQH